MALSEWSSVQRFFVLMLYVVVDFFVSAVDTLSDHWNVEVREERIARVYGDIVNASLAQQKSDIPSSSNGPARPVHSVPVVPVVPVVLANIPYPRTPQIWYVVTAGLIPGVYDLWERAHAQVVGISGNCYRGGFKSHAAAEIYYMQSLASGNVHHSPP